MIDIASMAMLATLSGLITSLILGIIILIGIGIFIQLGQQSSRRKNQKEKEPPGRNQDPNR